MAERVLIVESNQTRGEAMALLLRDLGGYTTVHARTIVDAFREVQRARFGLVITNSDVEQRADGLKLLQVLLLRRLFPQPPLLMVVTRESDRALVERCRRAGVVDYILYPYDVEDLLGRVARALASQRDMTQAQIRRAIEATLKEILELPTISPVSQRLQELLGNRDTSSGEVAQVIEIDQSATAKVLRLANSAVFGFTRHITSIKDAVSLIGFQQVADLVTGIATFETLGRLQESAHFHREAFWQHSVGCGVVAKLLAERVGVDASRAFAAGIVHDIGKVILDAYFAEYFEQALRLATAEHTSIFAAERRCLPVTHEEVGRHLALEWKLPEELAEAIGAHNSLEHQKPVHARLTELVHVADALCRTLGVGNAGDEATWEPNAGVLRRLGFSRADLEAWAPGMREHIGHAMAVLSLSA